MRSYGIWLVGACGGVSTTLACGLSALQREAIPPSGLVSSSPIFDGVQLPPLKSLVLGGHEIRDESLVSAARQIARDNGSLSIELLETVQDDLEQIDGRIEPGVLFNSGPAISGLEGLHDQVNFTDPRLALERILVDLNRFKEENRLDEVVVVFVASTEPAPEPHPAHEVSSKLEEHLAAGDGTPFLASTLYAMAAARLGCPFLNFTPSPGALLPAIAQLLEEAAVPFMGSDGKTGETLVKSALAPMFKYRNLKILSWQGYNLLGDRDGEILAHEANRSTKVASKDQLLRDYLGYPLHSKVTIDYVPSLGDNKTAWDFIHFEGFLGHRMSLQFTWQGCDSILAAPLVIDLARMLLLAKLRQESGPQPHLALFFKSPFGGDEHDLHRQFHLLGDYLASARDAS